VLPPYDPAMDTASVIDALGQLARREVSARELVEQSLRRIDERNPPLNAFVHLDPDGALAAADHVDATPLDERGPLAGVPFGVKDLEHCAGMPTTKGSRWFAGQAPVDHDDLHVGRLRAAGAIPVGKTAAPEFGAWAYTASPALGVTRNPWNTERTPGGSSGGSSAAVSSGMVPFCTASDGGGSIRTPAGFTGLVGLKPSYGRIPTLGVTHVSQNAVVGSLTTTVADHALLLDVMAGPDGRDRTCLPAPVGRYIDAIEMLDVRGLRVAFSADLGFAVVDPEVRAVCGAAFETLVAAAELRVVDADTRFDDYIPVYARMEGVDMFVDVDPVLWQQHLDELDPRVAPGWRSASTATLPKLADVYTARRRIEHRTASLFDEIDLLVTPMAAITAFAAEGPMPTEICGQRVHAGMSVPFAMLANLVNLPAISVPAGLSSDGMPIGLQIVAHRHRDDVCLRLARLLEQAAPWPRHAPVGP
jgi:aspartyl-tRNA(Asn)/glutamyl-tRNA(Gln) amidotransferase subunit A